MDTIQLLLTSEERDYLVELLNTAITEKHAEVRRTEFSSGLHAQLQREEKLLRGLVERLQQPVA